MKVYMGTYAKYNSGNLFGAWLALADYADWDEFMAAANKLHSDEHDPELMAQDWEGPDWIISEYGVAHEAWDYMALNDDSQAIVAHLVEMHGDYLGAALEQLEMGNFHIYYGSLEAYAYDYFNDCYDLPNEVMQNLDLEGYARDLILNGDAELMDSKICNPQHFTRDDDRAWFMGR